MPSLKDRDTNAPAASVATSFVATDSLGQKPVAMEVPVTVNGARPLEGNDKREPFSESTKTVLVFGNGAVIRLSFAVAPGQLLFLTNERTKKEVVCQVLKSKASRSSSYVEVEFTEPVSGFWGLRFPADSVALRSRMSLSDPDSDADEFLRAAMDTKAPLTRKLDAVRPVSEAASEDERLNAHVKPEERTASRANLPGEARVNTAKLESNRLQDRLAAWVSESEVTPQEKTASVVERTPLSDSAAKRSGLAEAKPATKPEPAAVTEVQPAKTLSSFGSDSGKEKSTLAAEELKVPSWLQPLTQDASASRLQERPPAKTDSVSVAAEPAASEQKTKALGKSQAVKATPFVGSGLLGQGGAPVAIQRSNKGLVIAIAAGLLVVGAGTTWYLQQQPAAPELDNQTKRAAQAPAVPAPQPLAQSPTGAAASTKDVTATSSQQDVAQLGPADTTIHVVATPLPSPSKPAPGLVPENASASSGERPSQQAALVTERIPNSSPLANAASAAPTGVAGAKDKVEPGPKKLNLDNASLAKPKVKRRSQSAGLAAPTLSETPASNAAADASLGAGLLPGTTSQPTAPAAATPVGSDVKPAHLLSSAAPVYPPIAKSQHIAGDVRIDALVDANGRVSSMKVISGPPLLHQAAMDALRQWKYQPATLNGTAVPMHLTVTLQFHLQ